jgi:hypothetical protein
MTKEEILAEIRRTAEENGGVPLGRHRFEHATGVTTYEWSKFWARFGDAQREAGFEPNKPTAAYSDKHLIQKAIELIRELGRFPTQREVIVKSHLDQAFPAERSFRRFGKKSEFVARVFAYCDGKPEYADVADICRPLTASLNSRATREFSGSNSVSYGFV